jgi:putative nucleotidyltransferase with HDIG domain
MVKRVALSLTLVRALVVLSALVLGTGGFVLAALVSSAMRNQAVEDRQAALTQYVDGVVGRQLVNGDRLQVERHMPLETRGRLFTREDIKSVKVWREDGVLAWTDTEPERIGRRFPADHHLERALEGETEAELEDLDTEGEHAGERRAGLKRALEVYAPLRSDDGGTVIGAVEIYADSSELESTIASRAHELWLVIAILFVTLCALLGLLARGASRRLRRQTRMLKEHSVALSESYEALERNTLEAIESLNATVEAKDPYTAGHSARVQRVAVALGSDLRVAPGDLDKLRLAGLFHDIGKIAIPDAILLKPARLTNEEYEQMKEHSAEGARIVGKLGSLREIVPLIRHHHERWDGQGYPDRLAGDDIPLLASIVGIADAWDAMTTDRPYASGRSMEEALEEIRLGRGTQFAPAVADALFRVAAVEPEVLAPMPARQVA